MEMSSIGRDGPESSQPAFHCSITFVALYARNFFLPLCGDFRLSLPHIYINDQTFSHGATLRCYPAILEPRYKIVRWVTKVG